MKQYLTRFNAPSVTENTIVALSELQCLHMQHIPFENLDVIRNIPIYLNLDRIYEKIVINNRGGYCYEVNGLFHSLLIHLDYKAHLIAATVQRPNGDFAKADTHIAIIVQLDQAYLVDVGFGDSANHPIPLDGKEHTDVSGTYKVKQLSGKQFDLMRKEGTSWTILYRFNIEEKALIDFHEGCIYNQVSKESSFTHTDLATIATPNGRITLANTSLTISEKGIQQKSDLSDSEKERVLHDIFGIYL